MLLRCENFKCNSCLERHQCPSNFDYFKKPLSKVWIFDSKELVEVVGDKISFCKRSKTFWVSLRLGTVLSTTGIEARERTKRTLHTLLLLLYTADLSKPTKGRLRFFFKVNAYTTNMWDLGKRRRGNITPPFLALGERAEW